MRSPSRIRPDPPDNRAALGGAGSGGNGTSHHVQGEISIEQAAADGPVPVLLLSADPILVARLHEGLAHSREVALMVGHPPEVRTPLDLIGAASNAGVVVADAALIERGAIDTSPRVQNVDGGPELILLFGKVGRPALETVLRSRAHGCIQSDITVAAFVRAARSVADGELWLPRWMLEIVYEGVLAEAERRRPAARGQETNELTPREIEVLQLVRGGLTNKQVARRLDISPSTVKKHVHNALAKRGLLRRRQAFE